MVDCYGQGRGTGPGVVGDVVEVDTVDYGAGLEDTAYGGEGCWGEEDGGVFVDGAGWDWA